MQRPGAESADGQSCASSLARHSVICALGVHHVEILRLTESLVVMRHKALDIQRDRHAALDVASLYLYKHLPKKSLPTNLYSPFVCVR
jgi:hypothetical protein